MLRRYGPAKTKVVDVARALGVSHGSVYRHFASKAALRDAVAERWLARSLPRSRRSPTRRAPAPSGCALARPPRRRQAQQALEDPELFRPTSSSRSRRARSSQAHVETLAGTARPDRRRRRGARRVRRTDPEPPAAPSSTRPPASTTPPTPPSGPTPGSRAYEARLSARLAALRPSEQRRANESPQRLSKNTDACPARTPAAPFE